jgi:hypothetical protein
VGVMKDLIKKILTEQSVGESDIVTINGIKLFVDPFISKQYDNSVHIFLKVVESPLTADEYYSINETLHSIGLESDYNNYTMKDTDEINTVSSIRVAVDVVSIIALYLNTSLDNKDVFNKF